MIINVEHPKEYTVELLLDEKLFERSKTVNKGKTNIDTFEPETISDFSLCAKYSKSPSKFTLLKKGWFNNLFSSFASYDYTIPKTNFSFNCSSRNTAELNIILKENFFDSSLNGDVRVLQVEDYQTKKCTIKKVCRTPIDEKEKKHILSSYVFVLLINTLVYFSFPIIYSIILFFFPFLIRGETFIDYIFIGFLSLLFIVNLIRNCICFKDFLRLVRSDFSKRG